MDFFRLLDLLVADQVIEVPLVSSSSCPLRAVLREPQFVEQLVEVPTVLSVAELQQRTAEQLVNIPVPRGRSGRRLQGSLPGQVSTAAGAEQIADFPFGEGLHDSPPGQDPTASGAEQVVDISSGGLQGFHLGQGSTASSSGAADEALTGVFGTFPPVEKVRVPPRVRPGTSAHGPRRLVARPSVPTSGCSSTRVQTLLLRTARTNQTARQPPAGIEVAWICEQSAAFERRRGGTGTRKRVSVLMTSHLFLHGCWVSG